MLNLRSTTSPDWIARVESHLEEVLIDHAHCEKKAAGVAMNFIFSSVEEVDFVTPLTEIVTEELDHFRQVLEIIQARGITFRRQEPSTYGRRLTDHVRTSDPGRIVDRLLVAALIEARSCERFAVLRDGLRDRTLADFYGRLFESEARHHATYVKFAKHFAPSDVVHARLEELSLIESQVVAVADPFVRIHS